MKTTNTGTSVQEADFKYMYHPGDPVDGRDKIVLTEGNGCTVRDSEGRVYLDGHAGAWLNQVGHGRKEMAEAVAAQLLKLAHFSTHWEYTNGPAAELAQSLVEKSPASLTRVRFGSSGSECTDEALQLARRFHGFHGEPERSVVLVLRGAYHGRTVAGWSLAGVGDANVLIPDNIVVLTPPWPYHTELYEGESVTDFCVRELEETIARIGAGRIAAMFGELVMGLAGMVPPPDDYWPRMVDTLHKNSILFVADEVVTAFGRSGSWFASVAAGIEPDIIVVAKGIASGYMPLGAVLMSEAVATAGIGVSGSGSYGGHAAACSAALENISIIEREGLLEQSVIRGELLQQKLAPLLALPIVGDIHGKGLMVGVELVRSKTTREPLRAADYALARLIREEAGIIVHVAQASTSSILITPPLTISEQEVVALADGLIQVLSNFANSPRVRDELTPSIPVQG